MASIEHITEYIPSEKEKFFLDTNVWMYLYCPLGNYDEEMVENYSMFYGEILQANSMIYTSSLQLSEFFNTYCKVEHNFIKREKPSLRDYKRGFRSSKEFLTVLRELHLIINERILATCHKLDDDFSQTDLSNILHTDKPYDFNDEYFLNICEKDDIIIVSNDRDLINSNREVKVLSNLKQC